jgi:molybdopterin-guanine dinucleotide biosynthesis protein A
LERGDYKVFPVLEDAGRQLARRLGEPFEKVFSVEKSMVFAGGVPGESVVFAGDALVLSPGQLAARELWFANLNTPEEFAEAERHLDALDELG